MAELNGKKIKGVVISAKMQETAVVLVSRFVKHKKLNKYYQKRKKFLVHNQSNLKKAGDKVTILECPPISKRKRFKIIND